jgi:hypothetical protein
MRKNSPIAGPPEQCHELAHGAPLRLAAPPGHRVAGPRTSSRPERIGVILARMTGTADTVGVVLEELGELAASVARVLGHSSKAGAIVEIASIVFHDASETAHRVGAFEIEQIRKQQEQHQAAGRGADAESRQNFARRCVACDATLRVCNMTQVTSGGKRCCADCAHPGPFDK